MSHCLCRQRHRLPPVSVGRVTPPDIRFRGPSAPQGRPRSPHRAARWPTSRSAVPARASIRTAIHKLRPTCWSQRRKLVGSLPVAKPLFPGGVPGKMCTTTTQVFVLSPKNSPRALANFDLPSSIFFACGARRVRTLHPFSVGTRSPPRPPVPSGCRSSTFRISVSESVRVHPWLNLLVRCSRLPVRFLRIAGCGVSRVFFRVVRIFRG